MVTQYKRLSPEYFGEGLAIVNKTYIVQLTWREKTIFKYDFNTFDLEAQYILPSKEGWGLTITEDGASLVMSDGSSFIWFLDPGKVT